MNEKEREYQRKYREERREESREYHRNYYKTHNGRERGRISSAKWRTRHPEKARENVRKDYQKHKAKRDVYRRAYRNKVRGEVLTHYGNGKCACVRCGMNNLYCLTIDHIVGCGNKHREKISPGIVFYRWLIRNGYPEGYQTLCMNCQFIKRSENKEWGVKNAP